jgi:arylsulfatase A
MRTNLFLILLTTILLSSCTKEQKQPNILFIFADQLRSMDLGCYGSSQVTTPNIDRLAHEGSCLQMPLVPILFALHSGRC